ncbi:MAG: hypothetical protein K1X89_29960, partial [Myxococcaceae bacterium]|nr:hypothetical protein [Myxococcaceae bacterium]
VPALTPAPVVAAAPAPVAPSAPPALRRYGLIAVALVALVAVAVTARWALRSPADDARAQIEGGKAIEALTALDAALAQKGASPELVAVKGIALHRLDRHKDELQVVRDGLPATQPAALDPQLLAGLAEDFGRREEQAVRDVLHRLPKEQLAPALVALAKARASPAQWGAARYLDLEQQGQGVDLVSVYVEALRSDACAVRRTAAKRLGQLGDWRAAEPLATLVNTPRSSTPEKACGQDEATEAITKLKPPAR